MDEKSTSRVSVFHADDTDGIYVDDDQGVQARISNDNYIDRQVAEPQQNRFKQVCFSI